MTARKLSSAAHYGAVPLLALALAGCASERGSFPGGASAPEPPLPQQQVAAPKPPPISMAGGWVLRSMGSQCSMTLGQTDPSAAKGTVAPGGGCPGNFFTTRAWSFDSNGLLLSNHNNQPMALLSLQGNSFSGSATNGGAPVTLSR